jgi:RNA polymerase sigma-70 factor, ECF subfamily
MIDVGVLLEPEIPRLRRYARALTGDAARADDLVEDCLGQAVQTIDLFWSGTDLRIWLFTILHCQLAGYGGQAARKRPATVIYGNAEAASTDGIPRSAPTLRNLRRALAKLSDEQRQVLLLVGLEGFRYDDVAKILDVPAATVRSRLVRGRNMLNAVMTGGDRPRSSVAA